MSDPRMELSALSTSQVGLASQRTFIKRNRLPRREIALAKFQLIVSDPKTKTSKAASLEGTKAQALVGKSIGEEIDGKLLGLGNVKFVLLVGRIRMVCRCGLIFRALVGRERCCPGE